MSAPVLLTPPGADRGAWLAARRQGIGASEIAAVMGISPWDSPFSLYWRKREGWEVEATEEMRVGTLVEPAVADWWAETQDPHENLYVVPAGLVASAERPWQLATPDRLVCLPCAQCDGTDVGETRHYHGGALDGYTEVHSCGYCQGGAGKPVAVLECKWTGAWHGWGEPETDDIPVYYRAQVQWQCDVMGVDEWYLAVLGPGGFRAYQGRRDERDLSIMRTAAEAFWKRVQAGDAPDVDEHSATLGALQRLHALGDGELDLADVVDRDEAVRFAEGYRRARALRAKADALVDRFEARIRSHLGDKHHRLVLGKKLIASRSVYEQSGDSAELTALEGDWPTVDRLNPGRSASYA